jgi:hypothetical protein
VTVLLVIGFNIVMLWLLEVPLPSFLIAPEETPGGSIERRRGSVGTHTPSRCEGSPRWEHC